MALNRIDPGTQCTIRETGERGILKKIYFYPTKYEIEFSDGKIKHYSIQDLVIDGIEQPVVKRIIANIPFNGIGERWTHWKPFAGESFIKHHFSTSKEIMWEMLTSLEMYNVWFYGIQRALPILNEKRYVHRFSFTHFDIKPGSYFKIRPKTVAPYFNCRIMTFEKEKEFGFTFQTTPFYKEFVQFTINETKQGVWVTCRRNSKGLFSFLSQYNWLAKSNILQNLDNIVPKLEFEDNDQSMASDTLSTNTAKSNTKNLGLNNILGLSKDDMVAYLVNKGLDGDMDIINSQDDKVIRGKAKAMIIKIKRGSCDRPVMPSIPNATNPPLDSSSTQAGLGALSKDDMIAYLVNKGLDGDMDIINSQDDKIIRGKAKAMIVKIKRGALDRPHMPIIHDNDNSSTNKGEGDEDLMERLISAGIQGEMDEINGLENKVLRGKIKAAIVKAKRK